MVRKLGIIVVALAALIISCSNKPADKAKKNKHTITIAGSTSVMPFTEKLAEHFMIDHRAFVIDVQGGGSTAGIQACLNNTVNIGMSSRELKEEEKMLNTITICYDGIAVVVHPKNLLKALTLQQVSKIFSGEIKNWNQLGWINRKIDAVTREEGSGTRSSFEELIMKKREIDDGIMVQDSNGSVKEVVATDPYAIGYISLGLIDQRVKSLTIDGVAPSIKNIKTGRYKIVRPFLYVTNGELDEDGKKFVNFVLSKDGQSILKKEGLVGFYD
ncbi:MAG: phosphate ABC transporter substrate-binding protein [Syntrophorhabdaceae bacterium]|nr:phosphate ABC transporter substrate-binding protein [Syntrophorhabdaceae bacterium]MDD5243998.1 phosphate ABC transporter substrate-binding protein [Syntrophorhabdaceae bacterium]